MQNYIMVDWAFSFCNREAAKRCEKWEKVPAYQSRRDRLHVGIKEKN